MKLNSLVRESHWAWSGDPALDVPPPDAAPDVRALWDVRLANARDTGSYAAVTKAGDALTLFGIRVIPKMLYNRVLDDYQSGKVGTHVGNCMLVKLGVRSVVNLSAFDGEPFKVTLDHDRDLGQVASDALLDLLAAYAVEARARGYTGPDPITELANHILRRQEGPSPK